MNKKKLLLWDADALAYLGKPEDNLNTILKKIDRKIQDVIDFTDADMYALFLSKGKYFRHEISKSKEINYSSYKSKRGKPTQKYVNTIKEYLIAEYGAVYERLVEADDLVVRFNNIPLVFVNNTVVECYLTEDLNGNCLDSNVETIIVSSDKDVLKNTVGKHINPNKKNEDSGNWEITWIETTDVDAWTHFFQQIIIGDTADSIPGLKGKGEAFFKKNIIDKRPKEHYLFAVLEEYIKHYKNSAKGIFEFQKNYRLLKMLCTDADYLREVGFIPTINNVRFIESKEKEEEISLNF